MSRRPGPPKRGIRTQEQTTRSGVNKLLTRARRVRHAKKRVGIGGQRSPINPPMGRIIDHLLVPHKDLKHFL